ncbi:MAG: type II secretion system GspH family protein [Candidatus Campbellbacteria bacterium]|nr:type II secretion system GspH family protein [Candidatus Campbellbacteria bacterium]
MKHKTNNKIQEPNCYMLHATRYMNAGFTLMELIVTVSIFALISTVVLVRNSQFDNEVLLADVAYDVALSIRQAQNYGIHVLGQGTNFDNAYGVYFEAGTDATTYKLFLDLDGNYAYSSSPEETLETFTLGRGFTVARLCDFSTAKTCDSELENANIIFERPNPDAIINTVSGGVTRALGAVGIELVTPRGGSRLVVVESTGQISVSRLEEAPAGVEEVGI